MSVNTKITTSIVGVIVALVAMGFAAFSGGGISSDFAFGMLSCGGVFVTIIAAAA